MDVEVISQINADGAARDFGWPRGVTQGASPQWAATEEQQRGQPNDRPLPLSFLRFSYEGYSVFCSQLTPLRVFVRWLLRLLSVLFPVNAAAGICEMASKCLLTCRW